MQYVCTVEIPRCIGIEIHLYEGKHGSVVDSDHALEWDSWFSPPGRRPGHRPSGGGRGSDLGDRLLNQ